MSKKTYKILSLLLCILLVFEQSGFAQMTGQLDISGYLTGLRNALTQDKSRPLHLRYLSYDILNNNFRLLLDKGDLKDVRTPQVQETTQKLLEYFFIGVSLPNSSFWVNLRPDSPDNIIDPYLAQTDAGKILLEADLQLKKDTAKYTSPENPKGKEYWEKLYKKAGELFGYDNITIPTLTRPWIVPDEIIVREASDNAYIYKATLKVQLEQDHLKDSAVYNFDDPRLKELNEYSSQLIRELIIPELTKEINTSKRYASLRQVYYSLILAQWFKQKFNSRDGFYGSLIDRRNLNGLTSKDDWSKTTYFKEYQKSFQKGEYNITEPISTPFGQTIRSYFSGGVDFGVTQQGQRGAIVDAMQRGFVQATTPGDVLAGNLHTLLVDVNKGGNQDNVSVDREAIRVNAQPQRNSSYSDSLLDTNNLLYEGTMGRWKYTHSTFDTGSGRLTLHNATRIPREDGVVEEEFLIDGQNKPRNILLHTRKLNSTEQGIVSAMKQELGIDTEFRIIIRDESAIKHRIYGIATQGVPFIREDIIAEGNRDQLKEALDHENRELTAQVHDAIRREQYQGNLRNLITQLSERDKSASSAVTPADGVKPGFSFTGDSMDPSEIAELNSLLGKLMRNETLDKGDLGRLGYLTLEDNIQRHVFDINYMDIESRVINRVRLFKRLSSNREFVEYLQTHSISLSMLWGFYTPLAEFIIDMRNKDKSKAIVIGINGGPGAGKSTATYILNGIIASMLDGEQVVSISLDDFYLTKAERAQKGIRWRGPPGTHDLSFARILSELKQSNKDSIISIPRFDTSKDDRRDKSEVIAGKVGVILFEGWLVGADEEGYDVFSREVDYLIHLSADIDTLKQWRFDREQKLRQQNKGGFSDDEMDAFWNDAILPTVEKYQDHIERKADMVVEIGRGRMIRNIIVKNEITAKKRLSMLLVDPHYRKNKIYGPPLGLAYIASRWQEYGQVGTADFNIMGDISTLKNFREEENRFLAGLSKQMDNYDIIGITVTTGVYPRALKIAKLAKSKGKMVVFGGPQVTLITSQPTWKSRIFEDSENSVDILVKGEGDVTVQEIAEHLSNNLALKNIRGISYRILDEYFFNPARKPIANLDELPFPAWELLPFRSSPKVAFLSAARGCPNMCRFCDERIIMPSYRVRSVSNIMKEIVHNAELGITRYRISDSTFSAYPHMEKLLDEIIASGLKLQFVAYARVDDILRMRHLLQKLKQAGLVLVYIGVESGSQRVLDAQNKKTTLGEIEETVHLCRQVGIKIKGSFIVGLVGETEADIRATIAFAKKLNLDVYSWHILAPSIGSLRQVPGYSDIDWKYVDTDVPDELIPEVSVELGDKARNLMIERHTIFKLDRDVPSNMPLHISGFTFAELYRLLKFAIEKTRQNSSNEAAYLHMDISGSYVDFDEFKERIGVWLPEGSLTKLDEYFKNKLTKQEQQDFVHRRFSKILEVMSTLPDLMQDEEIFNQIIKSDLLDEAIRSFNSYSLATRSIASNGKPGAIVEIADGKDAIIIGDLHGRYHNLDRVLQDERNMDLIARGEAHLVIIGDAVIPSLRALIKIMSLKAKYPRYVHYIPGNNDDLMVTDETSIHQIVYTEVLKQEFGEGVYAKCQEFIRQCPVAIKLRIGKEHIWLSHSEIPESVKSEEEIRDLLIKGYALSNTTLHELLWSRKFDPSALTKSLHNVNSRFMITGHTTMKQLKETLKEHPDMDIQFIEDGKVAIVSNRHIVIDAQEEDFVYLKIAIAQDLAEIQAIKDSARKKAFKQIRTSPTTSAGEVKADAHQAQSGLGVSQDDSFPTETKGLLGNLLFDEEDHAAEGDIDRADVEKILERSKTYNVRTIFLPEQIIKELEQIFGPERLGMPEIMIIPQHLMVIGDGRQINKPLRLGSKILVGDQYFAEHNNDLFAMLADLGHEAMAQWIAERRPDLNSDANELAKQVEEIIRVGQRTRTLSESSQESSSSVASKQQDGVSKKGGIDFRALPINQPLNAQRINMPLNRLDNFRTDPEWKEIQNMVNAGIIPSGQRIKDYLQSCCQKKELNGEIGRVLNCIADILRIEEERVSATDVDVRAILVLLESVKTADELQHGLNNIVPTPKIPQ